MAPLNPTVIAAHLDDEKLRTSIQKLVADIQKSTQDIKDAFDTSINHVEQRLKNLGNTKVDFKNLNINGTSSLENSLKNIKNEAKQVTMSLDQMQGALQMAKRRESIMLMSNPKTWTHDDIDKYVQILQQIVQLENTIAQKKREIALENAQISEKKSIFDAKAALNDITKVDDRLKQLNKYYKDLESQSRKSVLTSMRDVLKMPTSGLDEVWKKILAIHNLLKEHKGTGLLSDAEIKKLETAFNKLHELRKSKEIEDFNQRNKESIQRVAAEQERLNRIIAQGRESAMQSMRPRERWEVRQDSDIQRLRMTIHGLESDLKRLENYNQQRQREEWHKIRDEIIETQHKIAAYRQEQDKLRQTPVANQHEQRAIAQQFELLTQKIREAEDAVAKLRQKGLSAFTGDYVSSRRDELTAQLENAKAKVRELDAEMQRFVASEEHAAQVARQILDAKTGRAKSGSAEYLASDGNKVLIQYRDEAHLRSQILKIEQQIYAERNKQATAQKEVQVVTQVTAKEAAKLRQEFERAMSMPISKGTVSELAHTQDKLKDLEIALSQVRDKNIISPERVQMAEQEILRLKNEITRLFTEMGQQSNTLFGQGTKSDVIPKQTFATYESLRDAIAHVLQIQSSEVQNINMARASYNQLNAALKQAESAYNNLTSAERKSTQGQNLISYITRLKESINNLKSDRNSPRHLEDILGLRADTINNIIFKLQQLREYKGNIQITDKNSANEIKTVDSEIQRLTKDLQKYQGTSKNVLEHNNALTRSWNYMKNRLAFYLTVGATQSFVKQLIDVRGQYEMLERSIGILVNSAQQGTQIFAELNSMALKSPFTTMELGAAAKQLVAYDIKANEVVDTTRRLGDIAAAVGIPIERLTYALGQIKAYDYLNARDARMFSNAGIPLVRELGDYFTKLEGRMVSTADIYDRIKKKAISFNDVMKVMNSMTDQGGKFFNFQEKVADTLRVRIANLTLAWNNMLNEMGRENQGTLSWMLSLTKDMFEHWKNVFNVIISIIPAMATYKIITFLTLTGLKGMTAEEARQAVLGKRLSAIWGTHLKLLRGQLSTMNAQIAAATTLRVLFTGLVLALSMMVLHWIDLHRANEAFNKSVIDGTKENIESIDKFFKEYNNQINELGGTDNAEQQKLWERIQDEIETATHNAEGYLDVLLDISDTTDRISASSDILKKVQDINKEVQRLADKGLLKIGGGWGESLGEDLQDYQEALERMRKEGYKSVDELFHKINANTQSIRHEINDTIKEANGELKEFINALDKANLSNILGTGTVESKLNNLREYASEVRDFFLATEDGQKVTADGLDFLNHAIDTWIAKQALVNNLIEEREINGQKYTAQELANIESNRTAWEKFFEQLSAEDREYVDDMIKYNQTGSEDFKDIWDKAAKLMAENATTSYELIKQQIADMRNTPDIVINVIYRVQRQEMDAQQEGYVNRYIIPQNADKMSPAERRARIKANSQYYAKFNKKNGEDNVEWEKRLGEQYQKNEQSLKSLSNQLSRNNQLNADSRAEKEKELDALKEEQKVLKRIESDEGFNYEQFAKGGKGKGKKGGKKGTKPEDEVAKALKDELSIIKEMQSNYEKLRKVGFDATTALNIASSGYEGTLSRINAILAKFGVEQFKASDFVSNDSADPNKLLKALEKQRTSLIKSGKVKTASLKDLDVEIQKLTVDAKTYNMQKITDGLNREFEKLHNDYELSVELDANPELGDMFADMFNIDRSKLPHNMADLIKEAQKFADDAIAEYNKLDKSDETPLAPTLDIMRGDIQKWAKNASIDVKSDLFEKLKSEQDKLRDQYKNYMMETEKDLDDYVKKYGITADRIAEIEAEKQRKLRNLNNQYLDEQSRQTPEYLTKLDAINKGAAKEKDKVWFDDFKSSELYAQMFDRIEDVSTATLELLRGKVKQVKESLDELDPTQVKELTQQFAKIDEELIRRNPFKGLVKNYKEYISALKNQKQVEQDYLDAQKNYDAQMEVVAALEEQLKQKEYQEPLDSEGINSLKQQVIAARNLLKYLKQILGIKEEDNEENKKAISKFQKQAQKLANYLQEISKIVGTIGSITEALGLDEGVNEIINDIAQSIDGVAEMAQGMAQMSTNPIAGVSGIIGGLWKTVSGWFDNANKRIDRKIKKSEQAVNKLELAYIDLERAVSKSLGNAEIRARKLAIENKRLQLAQLQNQLRLEQSRSKKNRDDDKIVDLQKQIKELNGEIADMMEDITNNLLGSDIKSAAEDFVNTWVDAWRQGEDTMEALNSKFTEMIDQMIMKSLASKLVATRLKPIWDMVDSITNESSESGADITMNELKRIKELIGDKSISEAINQDLKNLYGALGIAYGSGKDSGQTLSNLQQGIQSITEDTANALEAYMNGVSQQVYLHSELLTQIRDAVVTLDLNVQTATIGQILLQLQQSHQVQMAIQNILMGWSNASGRAMRVEMI